jgi:DNA repair photolyase
MANLSFNGMELPPRRVLPLLGEQADIQYRSSRARSVLNTPEATGMGYWSLNPYVGCAFGCAYCYARYAHKYALQRAGDALRDSSGVEADEALAEDVAAIPAWLSFERRILVKENAADVLRRALRHGSERHIGLIQGETLVIGTATDPYQPAERKYRVTRSVLEVLAEHPGLNISIITKSPLVTRDVDLLRRIARHSQVSVHVSLISADRELLRRVEPRSPTPESRLRALARLRGAGVDAGVFCMPVLPGITDRRPQLKKLVEAAAAAGATHFIAGTLRLRSTARDRYLPVLQSEFPELVPRYTRAFRRNHELPVTYRRGLRLFVDSLCARYGIATDHHHRSAAREVSLSEIQMSVFD